MTASRSVATPIVDAHHHLWRYDRHEYDWIDDRMGALRRDFTAAELTSAMQIAHVDFAVAVQARQCLDETRALLEAAAGESRIAGVVGWLPLADHKALSAALDEFCDAARLRAARHVVQAEPATFLDGEDFNEGIRHLSRADLAFDLLLRADQLEEATRFVDRHPNQRFVLDHLAKPQIAQDRLQPWGQHIRELGRRGNVCCKISGLVTEAKWDRWSLATLRPYLDIAVEVFGADRLLVGSDWPVCLLASKYATWWQTLRTYFASFTEAERRAIFGGNAVRLYQLVLPASGSERG